MIDPRRDVEVHVELARAQGCRITRILETHYNEDPISGPPIRATLSGASVHHSPNAAGDVAEFAGWLLEADEDLVLVAADADEAGEAARRFGRTVLARGEAGAADWALLRNGFEDVDLFLGSMGVWRSGGLPVRD